jgi:hypothetical protein
MHGPTTIRIWRFDLELEDRQRILAVISLVAVSESYKRLTIYWLGKEKMHVYLLFTRTLFSKIDVWWCF